MDDKNREQTTDNAVVEAKEQSIPHETNPTPAEAPTEKEIISSAQVDKIIRKTQYFALIFAIIFLVWYFILSPEITFRKSEKIVEEAGKSYFDYNYSKLPTGERVSTVTLQELFSKSFIKEDIYIPHTKEPCSLKESWVKVRKVNGEYKYYTYLKCGLRQSSIDHEGPKITLNGEETITLDRGDEYKELGVKSVVDNKDGKLNAKDVTIKSNKVNTNEPGEYKVTYTAFDSLKNKTTVTRKVKVIEMLKGTVQKSTEDKGYYTGKNPNNYIYFSGILFRIVDTDGTNVRIVAYEDISNVNYAGINSWLKYFYEHLSDEAKKLVVKNKYCNMTVDEQQYTTTECTSYTKKLNAYIPSITDINKSETHEGNFMKPYTISWTANAKDDTHAFATSEIFYGGGQQFELNEKTYNYGIRPMLTIKGDTLIKSGNGSYDNPYRLGETKTGKPDDKINTRHSGEYIKYSGMVWRIIEVNDDGTTKVISDGTIKKDGQEVKTHYDIKSDKKIYNPKQSGNVGYFINHKVSEFIDTSYFVNKNVEVPIYKNDILYGKETKTTKYKVKLSAPNMYELFSAQSYESRDQRSFWLINSSNEQYTKAAVTDIGVVVTYVGDYDDYGIRVVANLHKGVMITKGKGTLANPYNITK